MIAGIHFPDDLKANHRNWYLRWVGGETTESIAQSADVSTSTVYRAVRKVEEVLNAEFSIEVQNLKREITESQKWKIGELHRAWTKSKRPKITMKFSKVVARKTGEQPDEDDPEFAEDQWQDWQCERVIAETNPDAKYLSEARACEKMLAELWSAFGSDDRANLDEENDSGMTDEQLTQREIESVMEQVGPEFVHQIAEKAIAAQSAGE